MRLKGGTLSNPMRKMSCTLFRRVEASWCFKVNVAVLNREQRSLCPQAQNIGLKISVRISQLGWCFGGPKAGSWKPLKQQHPLLGLNF